MFGVGEAQGGLESRAEFVLGSGVAGEEFEGPELRG